MPLGLLASARRAVFGLVSSILKVFGLGILVAVVAVVAVLAVPHLHSWAQTLASAAQLASSLVYNTCTSHTCRIIVLGSLVSSGIAAVLTVRRTWAWLRKDQRKIAMLEQTIRQLRADMNSLSFLVVVLEGDLEEAQARITNLQRGGPAHNSALQARIQELLRSNQAYQATVTQLRAALEKAQAECRGLLAAPEVRPLAALNRLGLPSRAAGRNAAAAPVLALVREPTVADILLKSDLPAALAVTHIAGYLKENGDQLHAFMGAPFFGMGASTDLFSGSATLSKDANAKANAVALALVAARDAGVRRQLKAALVPAYTGESGAGDNTDWVGLSKKLFKSTQWAEQGREKGAEIRDVLQYIMGSDVDRFWKYVRVAAALMLGLLMREGVMV